MRLKASEKWTRLGLAAVWFGAAAGVNCLGQAVVAVTPSADAFVRSLAPASNFGLAGALSVSGSDAVNGAGQQAGWFDSFLRFPTGGVAASFDESFGSNGWVVTSAALVLTEVAAPNNTNFNRGVGAFEVRWIASAAWVEGTGTPNLPTTDGVVYQDLGSVLNPALDVTLGQFTNSGANGVESFSLKLADALLTNLVSGSDLNLYLTTASASVGFTFNSRNFGTASGWPSLQVTAAPRPAAAISAIERLGMNTIAIRFNTPSNWAYVVQATSRLGSGNWTNLSTVPAQPFDAQAVVVDSATNAQRFYRLRLSR